MTLDQMSDLLQADSSDIVRTLFMKGIALSMTQALDKNTVKVRMHIYMARAPCAHAYTPCLHRTVWYRLFWLRRACTALAARARRGVASMWHCMATASGDHIRGARACMRLLRPACAVAALRMRRSGAQLLPLPSPPLPRACARVQLVASEYGVVVVDKDEAKVTLARKRSEYISDEDIDDLAPRCACVRGGGGGLRGCMRACVKSAARAAS